MQLPLVAMVLREASALMRISRIYIYIYNKYTHRESLVRNHEPFAKALGNYNYYIIYNRRAERAPHLSYSGEKSSSYIYICFLYIYIYIYIRSYVVHARATRKRRTAG